MNKVRIAISFISLLLLSFNCFAYMENYPPFPFKTEQNLKFLKASKIIEDEGKVVLEDGIIVESTKIKKAGFIYNVIIRDNKKIIFKKPLKLVYSIY